MKKTGFTLIELLAVITILALIILIATPQVVKIINNSKERARKESVELYGKAIENAIANYYTEYSDDTNVTLEDLESKHFLEYEGSKVDCSEVQIVGRKVYLNDCKVISLEILNLRGVFK